MTPRIAIVTGAAGGIGRAIVGRLAAERWSVAAVDIAPNDQAAEPPTGAGTVIPLQYDLTGAGTPQKVISETLECFGRVDLVVNNAGIGNAKPAHGTTDEEIDRFLASISQAVSVLPGKQCE